MDDGGSRQQREAGGSQQEGDLSVEVRTRWSPKPEQVRILETIFNSGMVHPSKEETVQIRKHLEQFGSVQDVNVFKWFQNRRFRARQHQRQIQAVQDVNVFNWFQNRWSRSRQHQRQIEASLSGAPGPQCGGYNNFVPSSWSYPMGSTSSPGLVENDHVYHSGEFPQSDLQVQQFEQNPLFCSPPGLYHSGEFPQSDLQVQPFEQNLLFCSSPGPVENDHVYHWGEFPQSDLQVQQFEQNPSSPVATNFPHQSVSITVFINGVAMEVGRGGLDINGENLLMFNSLGVPVEVNEYGFMVQGLQHGESYFLVPRV